MQLRPPSSIRHLVTAALILFGLIAVAITPRFAATAVQDRVGEIDNNSITPIRGNLRGEAQARYDRGPVEDSFTLENVTMAFKPSPGQESALDQLLADQQNLSSPSFHQWLTPEQFADRFGLSENDMGKVVSWLQDQGFSVNQTARGRTWLSFSGTASQINAAFHTEIHRYDVNGETHYANAVDPSVPSALGSVVLGFRGLDDFHPKARAARQLRKVVVRPDFTSSLSGNHYLAPNDFATIYGVQGLYSSGITGSGEKIAVMGQTDFAVSDLQAFRAAAGLSTNNPVTLLVPGSPDPGTKSGDLIEADLDLEWSGGLAPSAPLLFVNSTDAFTSLQYAIDQDLAPVLTISYGACETAVGVVVSDVLSGAAKQASTQGMTMVAAAGDDGAADCDQGTPTTPPKIATHGLAVDIPAAIPYFTAVGGTQFDDSSGSYWNASNNTQMGSATGYIPESAWNETVQDGSLAAGGGGASIFFAKPSWQTGKGVPNDGKRDVPDISLNAAADHDPYLICTSGSCVNGFRAADNTLQVVGGTSAGAPSFAAIMSLIDQRQKGAQGNANPNLYSVAARSSSAFHDVTSGSNMVPCQSGTTNCPSSGQLGFSAGVGYDLATGLGSLDVENLATNWASTTGPPPPDFQVSISPSTVSLSPGGSGSATVTITALNGFATAVAFSASVPSTLAGVTVTPPASITGSGMGTLSVTASSTARVLPLGPKGPGAGLKLALLLLSGVALGLFRLRRQTGLEPASAPGFRLWLGLALACLLAAGVSCGGGNSSTQVTNNTTPPPESATVTVQATSGSLVHSATFTVSVN